MTQDSPSVEPYDDHHANEDIFDATVVKLGFCPDCGTVVLVMGDHDVDVAVAHLKQEVLDALIADMQSIRYRLNN